MNLLRLVTFIAALGSPAALPTQAFAQSDTDSARVVLKIPERCYPVAINRSTEQISTVCRGQEGWNPDGLQLFELEMAGTSYMNRRTGAFSSLVRDYHSGVGPVPWFTDRWFPELDRNNIARPR